MPAEGPTRFQYDILAVLAAADDGGGRYGLGVKEDLESQYGQEVNHGRLYPNLDDLVDMGLVTKRKLDDRTNEYQLTATGVDALEARFQFLHDSISGSFVIEHGSGGSLTFRRK